MLEISRRSARLAQVLSVSELNRLARVALEKHLPLAWVAGEISNFKRYDSGHCYFTLKDETAQVDCVMFRHEGDAARLAARRTACRSKCARARRSTKRAASSS